MKTVTVVTEIEGQEAIYVDGILKLREDNVYACDIAAWAGDEPIIFQHRTCDFELRNTDLEWEWPEKIEDVPFETQTA